jgi:hypothetical protein
LPGSSGMILGGGIDADADWIYVSAHGTGSVYKIGRLDPTEMVQLVPNNYFKYPQDIVLVARNTLLVNDLYGHAVYVVRTDDEDTSKDESEEGGEAVVELAAVDLHYPRSIVYRRGENKSVHMFVSELNPNRVVEVVYEDGHGVW